MNILYLVGLSASGKTTLGKHITQMMKVGFIETSVFVYAGYESSLQRQQGLSILEFMKTMDDIDPLFFTRQFKAELDKLVVHNIDDVIIDGMRRIVGIERLHLLYHPHAYRIVDVSVPEEQRHHQYFVREGTVAVPEERRMEEDFGLRELRRLATVHIVNNTSLVDFLERGTQIIRQTFQEMRMEGSEHEDTSGEQYDL